MLVSGGQILAIDKIYTDGTTLVGDGVKTPAAVNTEVIATTKLVSGTSAKLQSEIDDINDKFDDYYNKTETSSKEEISAAFENFKTDQTIVSAGSDKVSVDAIPSGDKTIIYKIDVTPGAVSIAGASGISAKQVDDTWILGLSANFLSANALDVLSAYYKKSETSAATAIDAAFAATSSWANKTFQPSGNYLTSADLQNYYTKEETSGRDAIQTALDLKQNKADMSAYQLSGDYVSASDFDTYKELVKQEFTNTSAWAISSFQPSGKYVTSANDDLAGKNLVLKDNAWTEFVETDWTPTISAASANAINSAVNTVKNKFELTEDNKASGYDGISFYHQSLEDYYKKSETSAASAISAAFKNTSAWATDTFQPSGNYLTEVSAESPLKGNGTSADPLTVDMSATYSTEFADGITAVLDKTNRTLTIKLTDTAWADYQHLHTSANIWDNISAYLSFSANYVTSAIEQFQDNLSYFLTKNGTSTVWSGVDLSDLDKPLMSGYGTSAWYDEAQDKYFVSAKIAGNHGISAEYDSDANAWNVGISANEYAYYSNTYENNAGESVDTDTIIKFVDGISHNITVDSDGYITLPDTGNKFTVCVNETVTDNIDSNSHAYLSNKIQLCKRENNADTVLVATNNYYATEVGTSDATIAYTLTHSPNVKYFIKYAGSKVDVTKNANAKLHIVISILEEISSLATTEGGSTHYTGVEPIYVDDTANKIGLAFDRTQFQITEDADPNHPGLSALQINIQTTGGNIDQEAFEKLAGIINGRMTETIPFGALNTEGSLAGSRQYSYLFRPTIEYDMTSATVAYMHGGNANSNTFVSVAVYEGVTGAAKLIWESDYTQLPVNGGQVVMHGRNNGISGTITPDALYYACIRIDVLNDHTSTTVWNNVLGLQMGSNTTTDLGNPKPWLGLENVLSLDYPTYLDFAGAGSMDKFAGIKPYIGFRTQEE